MAKAYASLSSDFGCFLIGIFLKNMSCFSLLLFFLVHGYKKANGQLKNCGMQACAFHYNDGREGHRGIKSTMSPIHFYFFLNEKKKCSNNNKKSNRVWVIHWSRFLQEKVSMRSNRCNLSDCNRHLKFKIILLTLSMQQYLLIYHLRN